MQVLSKLLHYLKLTHMGVSPACQRLKRCLLGEVAEAFIEASRGKRLWLCRFWFEAVDGRERIPEIKKDKMCFCAKLD